MEKEGRDCSSSFVSLCGARPGRAQVQHPVWGSWGCHCALLFLSPPWCDKGSSHSVMFGLWEGNLQFHGRMAQSSSLRRWEERKEAAVRGIPKSEVLGWRFTDQTDGPELPLLCVGWWEMRVKEPENWHLSISGHVQMMAMYKWRDQSLMYKELP